MRFCRNTPKSAIEWGRRSFFNLVRSLNIRMILSAYIESNRDYPRPGQGLLILLWVGLWLGLAAQAAELDGDAPLPSSVCAKLALIGGDHTALEVAAPPVGPPVAPVQAPRKPTPAFHIDPTQATFDALLEVIRGDFEIIREVGSGAENTAYLVRLLSAEDIKKAGGVQLEVLVVPRITPDRFGRRATERARQTYKQTREILKRVQAEHPESYPYFVPVLGAELGGTVPYLRLAAKHGSLSELLPYLKKDPQHALTVLEIGERIARALSVLHQMDIAHNDVKTANILVDKIGGRIVNAQLSDMGLAGPFAVQPSGDPNILAGTIRYFRPSSGMGSLKVDPYLPGVPRDMYALKLVLQELALATPITEFQEQFPKATKERRPYSQMTLSKSPHEIDPNIPEILSSIVWAEPRNTTELLSTFDHAKRYWTDPNAFYRNYFGPRVLMERSMDEIVELAYGDIAIGSRLIRSGDLGVDDATVSAIRNRIQRKLEDGDFRNYPD